MLKLSAYKSLLFQITQAPEKHQGRTCLPTLRTYIKKERKKYYLGYIISAETLANLKKTLRFYFSLKIFLLFCQFLFIHTVVVMFGDVDEFVSYCTKNILVVFSESSFVCKSSDIHIEVQAVAC